ncbi:hypothetical protein V5799_020629 [Amblyomma americanum]|uniref:Hexosyltransferase n=1 Tax=Amblyomma americanum TaxID=6943 RepID=A0AAQ4ETI9_AMBAM
MSPLKRCFYALVWTTMLASVIFTLYLEDAEDQGGVLLRAALASEGFAVSGHVAAQSLKQEAPTSDWAIRRECGSPLSAVFIIFTEASDWKGRASIRATLLGPKAKAFFNWSGVFVLEQPTDALVSNWTDLEARATGDVLTLATPKDESLRTAVRWALDQCPGARYVIKIADDMAVQAASLYDLLLSIDRTSSNGIRCDIRHSSADYRSTQSEIMATKETFFARLYERHCSERVLLSSQETLRDLDRPLRPLGPAADAYSNRFKFLKTDTSVLIRNIVVRNYSEALLCSTENATFVHLTEASTRTIDRMALWFFTLWQEAVFKRPSFRQLLTGTELFEERLRR